MLTHSRSSQSGDRGWNRRVFDVLSNSSTAANQPTVQTMLHSRAAQGEQMVVGESQPLEGFADFFEVEVAVDASMERLYELVTDIEGLTSFFPSVSFKVDSDIPLAVGSTYHTRQKGSKTWVPYRVLALDPNARMSAELVGKDPLFRSLRYDHQFVAEGSTTLSRERVDYTFRYGYAGRVLNFVIGKRLVRKQVLDAHKRLREAASS